MIILGGLFIGIVGGLAGIGALYLLEDLKFIKSNSDEDPEDERVVN